MHQTNLCLFSVVRICLPKFNQFDSEVIQGIEVI